MSVADLHTKPLEEILMAGKITLWCKGFRRSSYDDLGQPIYEPTEQWWQASIMHPKVEGEGPSPREAVIQLYKNLDSK